MSKIGRRPALIQRTLESTANNGQRAFYACWEHAELLEDDVAVEGYDAVAGTDDSSIAKVDHTQRDGADCCCDFCG